MRFRSSFIFLAAAAFQAVQATDIHVPADYPTIQEGVNAAVTGDTVIVADGTYTGPGNWDIDLSGKHFTIRSANGPATCIIDLQGTSSRGFYLMIENPDNDNIPVEIKGFTVKNSRAQFGGGLYVEQPGRAGTGIRVDNCVFYRNGKDVVGLEGGAIYAPQGVGGSLFTRCVFDDNGPDGMDPIHTASGGAIKNLGSFIECTFRSNGAGRYGEGGAAYACGGFYSCIFEGNEAGSGGAGFLTSVMNNCIFRRNNAYGGGASALDYPSTGEIRHCAFVDNGNLAPTYCISAAASEGRGQIFYPRISNSIFWGNGPENIRDVGDIPFPIDFCDIEGGYAGPGNISIDPMFVDRAGGDLHLAAGSPCIDTGSNGYQLSQPIDFDGVTRPQGPQVDIGPYEKLHQVQNAPPTAVIAGAPQLTVECAGPTTPITLDGSGSHDPDVADNSQLTYSWSCTELGLAGSASTISFNAPDGDYTVELTVEDPHGATSTATIDVHIVDTTPPSLTLNGTSPMTVECGATFTDPGASASDICDGDLSDVVQVSGSVDTMHRGTYVLTYSVSDGSGNPATPVQREVRVVDTTPPTLTLNGNAVVVIPCGGAFTDPGASAYDSCDGELSGSVLVSGSVDTMHPGSYPLTYSVSDASGNPAVPVHRTVKVVYEWSGFLQPINQDNSSIFKKGSTIPVKFRLTGHCADDTGGSFRLYYAQVSGAIVGTEVEATSTSAADTGNYFRASGGHYIYNLSTKTRAIGTWQLRADLGDGVSRTVLISIK